MSVDRQPLWHLLKSIQGLSGGLGMAERAIGLVYPPDWEEQSFFWHLHNHVRGSSLLVLALSENIKDLGEFQAVIRTAQGWIIARAMRQPGGAMMTKVLECSLSDVLDELLNHRREGCDEAWYLSRIFQTVAAQHEQEAISALSREYVHGRPASVA